MRFDILTLFPEMFKSPFEESIIKRAKDKQLVEIVLHQIRDFTTDKHRTVDDAPYGGGAGMLMKPEPLAAAIRHAKLQNPGAIVVAATPAGRRLDQALVSHLAAKDGLIIICGRYEGFDERILQLYVDKAISVGDYVLSGGELAAMVMVDAVTRMLPGVLGCEESAADDSFSDGLLEHPQYTRPRCFSGYEVPEVLLSGDHARIKKWRRQQSLQRTLLLRPDLLHKNNLSADDQKLLQELEQHFEN